MKSPITIERREKQPKPEPKHKWVLPLVVGIAIATLAFMLIFTIALGRPLF